MQTAPRSSATGRIGPLLSPRPELTSHLVGIKWARPSRFNSQEKTSVSYGAVCKNGVQADSAFRQKSSKGIRGARKPCKFHAFLMISVPPLFSISFCFPPYTLRLLANRRFTCMRAHILPLVSTAFFGARLGKADKTAPRCQKSALCSCPV